MGTRRHGRVVFMSGYQVRNRPELEQYARTFAAGAAGPEPHTPRAEHFASCVRFSLDEPEAMRRLHQVTRKLRDAHDLTKLLPHVLEGAMALTGADFGNVQLFDPVTGALTIAAHSGFSAEFLDYFAVVDDDHAACGPAAKICAQAVIIDVCTEPGFAPRRKIAAAAGFRAVQSTPLIDFSGHLIGMVSTHFRRPCRLSDRDLKILEYYGDFVREVLAGHLGTIPAGDHDSIGRAVVGALLDPRQEWPPVRRSLMFWATR